MIEYKFGKPERFTVRQLEEFLELLKKQGRVIDPSMEKIKRCHLLGACLADGSMVAIGAIKPKTKSDFSKEKADLEHFRSLFDYEVGYFYTDPAFSGRKISSTILDRLMEEKGNKNLMASTEIRKENAMVHSLENRGFVRVGKSWTSQRTGETLRLFLRLTH